MIHDPYLVNCYKGHIYCRLCYGNTCPECLEIKEKRNADVVKVANRGNGNRRRVASGVSR